ncbi:MAG: nitrogenase component 1 [Candidatus Woesearchaeota archaeon]
MDIDQFRIKHSSYVAMHGAFVASHCISDSLIFLSIGIGCKAQLPHYMGGHELENNFVSRMGWAELDGDDIINGDVKKIRRNLLGQIERNIANFYPVVISPVVKTIGMESLIENTAEEMRRETGENIWMARLSGAESDFWEGYNSIIIAFIESMDWRSKIEKKTVNIFGYPFDRYEMEHRANIKELRKMLAKIGIKVQAVFLSGTSTTNLQKARKAEYNIILPHSSTIGDDIEKITGKPSIYTDIPMGISNTRQWIKQISIALNRGKRQAQEYLDEQKKIMEKFQGEMKSTFNDVRVGLILDLPFIGPMTSLLEGLGAEISYIIIRDRYYGGKAKLERILKFYNEKLSHIDIQESPSNDEIIRLTNENDLDLVIGSASDISIVKRKTDAKTMTFGFPSYGKHYTDEESPFLGFEGYKNFTGEISDILNGKDQR